MVLSNLLGLGTLDSMRPLVCPWFQKTVVRMSNNNRWDHVNEMLLARNKLEMFKAIK